MLTIVFDLDGTLIDTAPDLIDTLNLVLAREGLPRMPFEAARRLIGGGAGVWAAAGQARPNATSAMSATAA